MPHDLSNLRNIGVIAHIDAGKTTVTERMLHYAHFSHRVGRVDKGTTVTDFREDEQERGITIVSACVTFPWKESTINLIDTPGHVDFTAEVERSLRVLDGGVVVFSAREGVEAQSETVWRQADKYHVPRLAFINKMDREGADFFTTVEEIKDRLDADPLVINLPVGAGPPHFDDAFRGVIDLIAMRMLIFDPETQGADISVSDIPPDMLDDAEAWRVEMLDRLSMFSDEMTELLLAEEPVPNAMIRQVLRDVVLHDMLVPVLCGSALDGIGIQPLMDSVAWYLPSPLDMPSVKGHKPGNEEKTLMRKPDSGEPFCGLLFKIQADRHGDLHYVRIYSGRLKANSRVLNPGKEKKENVPQLWRIQADDRKQESQVSAGDIIGIVGLKHSITGDTLCDAKHPILLESITFPETVISMAIEPESSIDRKKLTDALHMMKRQDPTFRADESEETGQTLISGMGELHLDVIKDQLLDDFKLNVRVHHPRVSYRETVASSVEVVGGCHRTIAGQSLFAELTLRLEPLPEASRPVIVADCGDALPEEFLAAAIESLTSHGDGGGMFGFPLVQVKITILDGKTHETESNEMAFQMAAGDAFDKALHAAGIVLLEPVMRLEITTPEDYIGDFISDLQKRRAMITHTHHRGKNTILDVEAPLSELFGYSGTMRGLSQGRATCSMEPLKYGPAPPEVLKSFL